MSLTLDFLGEHASEANSTPSAWSLAFPFVCAAMVLFVSSVLSWSAQKRFRNALENAWHDGSGNRYMLPARFDRETIYGTLSRDSDALALPAAALSSVPAVIVLVKSGTPLYDLTILLSAGLPLVSFVAITSIPWDTYNNKLCVKGVSFVTLLTGGAYIALAVFAGFWAL